VSDIDVELLPAKCLADTGVLIRALGQREDEHSEICRAFFDAMVQNKRQILVAAPTVAEMLRGNPQPLPRTRSIIVVAFDNEAAQLLGLEMHVSVLKDKSKIDGLTRTYMKYDAMIVACAKRWEAECIVALDDDHIRMAAHVQMPVKHPRQFLKQQTVLQLFGDKPSSSEG
jgi:predicted nucleic acid-binding protein